MFTCIICSMIVPHKHIFFQISLGEKCFTLMNYHWRWKFCNVGYKKGRKLQPWGTPPQRNTLVFNLTFLKLAEYIEYLQHSLKNVMAPNLNLEELHPRNTLNQPLTRRCFLKHVPTASPWTIRVGMTNKTPDSRKQYQHCVCKSLNGFSQVQTISITGVTSRLP